LLARKIPTHRAKGRIFHLCSVRMIPTNVVIVPTELITVISSGALLYHVYMGVDGWGKEYIMCLYLLAYSVFVHNFYFSPTCV